jgi:hypothetical protein
MPALSRIIEVEDSAKFILFARRLLAGPPIEERLRAHLALVLLLRHDNVQRDYPGHRLVICVETAAAQCGVEHALLRRWISATADYFRQANNRALSLAQVRHGNKAFQRCSM